MKFLIFCLFMLVLVCHGQDLTACHTKCGKMEIKFPFKLTGQPLECGYPGFDLDCIAGKHTVLNLTSSVRVYVEKIDYRLQLVSAKTQPDCNPSQQMNFNISASRFQFQFSGYSKDNCTFFNCSGGVREIETPVHCLSNAPAGYVVYAIYSNNLITYSRLTNCTKMYSILDLPSELFSTSIDRFQLNWTKPNSSDCEIKHQACRLKLGSKSETECFQLPGKAKDVLPKVLISIGSFVLLIFLVSAYLVYRADRKEKENRARIETFLEDYKTFKPTRYLYSDLKRITDQFKDKLGQGAHGTVFKGSLSSEIHVAVKMLHNSTGTGDEFINEVGTMGRIHHVNIVRMVGFCADGFRRALVYEFLPNESLEKFILTDEELKAKSSLLLSWEQLYEIAVGIARGIEYLHQGCDHRILHFDIKPHNILLDENFTPKVADFGLAKLCSKDQSAVSMTAERGTVGYIAPEVFSRNFGSVSYKSDVYSFGMLLLEMVGGKRKTNDQPANNEIDMIQQHIYFPEWIYNQLENGEEDVRVRIEREGDARIARKLTVVGLWCIQWYPVDRPSMKMVVQMLQGDGEDLKMPPNPFASAGSKKIDGVVPGRKLYQELEVISENE